MAETFTALQVSEPEPKIFSRQIIQRSIDDLPAGELLVRVRYSSLNYKDALSASGHPGVTRQFPHTPASTRPARWFPAAMAASRLAQPSLSPAMIWAWRPMAVLASTSASPVPGPCPCQRD